MIYIINNVNINIVLVHIAKYIYYIFKLVNEFHIKLKKITFKIH